MKAEGLSGPLCLAVEMSPVMSMYRASARIESASLPEQH